MEEISVSGMVLKSIQYREKDKLIHIFTVELGLITAILKGVSNNNAKLKYASQPFCFGKFELVKNKEFFTVKNVELIDSFFDVTQDYDVFALCNSMLEVCHIILKPGIISEELFLILIKSLDNIFYKNIPANLAVLKFHIEFLRLIGYQLNFDSCDSCGLKFVGDIKFNFDTGTFRCANCSNGKLISKLEFTVLKNISSTPFDRLHTIKFNSDCIDACLNLILKNISFRLNTKIKSINV